LTTSKTVLEHLTYIGKQQGVNSGFWWSIYSDQNGQGSLAFLLS